MTDPRLEKCCGRIHEIGGDKKRIVKEDEVRITNAINSLEEELEEEYQDKTPNAEVIELIRARIALRKRDLYEMKKRG